MDYLQSKTGKSSQNANEQFLLNLLLDMAVRNLRQGKNIKKRLLDVLESIFDNEEQQSASVNSSSFLSTSFAPDDYSTSFLLN
jgi:hypothetical protein